MTTADLTNECPYCGHTVAEGDTHAEIAHMERAHPDVIEKRLLEIGEPYAGFDERKAQEGIPNAWGQYGVSAVYVDTDGEDESEQPRKLVCIDTAMCETALAVEGAEELLRRVYDAVAEIRHGDEARAHREAGERGEHYLEDVRDELGPSAYNSLRRGKVLTIEQVQRLSDAELLAIPNLGTVRLARIREVCGADATSRPRAARPKEEDDDGETITCTDGTIFCLQREHGLHEPPWYSILRRDVGASRLVSDEKYDGSNDKRTVLRRMRRRAAEWERGER